METIKLPLNIKIIPKSIKNDHLKTISNQILSISKNFIINDEIAHVFYIPIILNYNNPSIQDAGTSSDKEKAINEEKITTLQKQIDDAVFDLYNIHPDDRRMIKDELRQKKKSNEIMPLP